MWPMTEFLRTHFNITTASLETQLAKVTFVVLDWPVWSLLVIYVAKLVTDSHYVAND